MSELTVSMPSSLQSWVDARLSRGDYVDAGDYLRDLVRRDQAAGDRQWLKAMIDEGLASGIIDAEPEDVLAEIIAEDPDLRG